MIGVVGCKKYNQVDNSGTVKTPYILHVGGFYGTLFKTNDALYFNTLFNTDHSTVRQVLAADTMLLYLKEKFYFSRNEGQSFQLSVNDPRNFQDLFYKYFLPNQAVYDRNDRLVYLCTATGLRKSSDNGETFVPETNYDVSSPPITPNSITQTDNGNVYMLKDFDEIYEKPVGAPWRRIGINTPLPVDTTWYITHSGNTLLAVDYSGGAGIYTSTDAGVNWFGTSGLPPFRKVLFGKQAIQSLGDYFAGTDSGGLYRLEAGAFVPSGLGIPWYAKVHHVVGKKIVYRTNVERYYHFCATDIGLYMSENNGRDWRLIKSGAFSTLY
jgi:hypothetical protein